MKRINSNDSIGKVTKINSKGFEIISERRTEEASEFIFHNSTFFDVPKVGDLVKVIQNGEELIAKITDESVVGVENKSHQEHIIKYQAVIIGKIVNRVFALVSNELPALNLKVYRLTKQDLLIIDKLKSNSKVYIENVAYIKDTKMPLIINLNSFFHSNNLVVSDIELEPIKYFINIYGNLFGKFGHIIKPNQKFILFDFKDNFIKNIIPLPKEVIETRIKEINFDNSSLKITEKLDYIRKNGETFNNDEYFMLFGAKQEYEKILLRKLFQDIFMPSGSTDYMKNMIVEMATSKESYQIFGQVLKILTKENFGKYEMLISSDIKKRKKKKDVSFLSKNVLLLLTEFYENVNVDNRMIYINRNFLLKRKKFFKSIFDIRDIKKNGSSSIKIPKVKYWQIVQKMISKKKKKKFEVRDYLNNIVKSHPKLILFEILIKNIDNIEGELSTIEGMINFFNMKFNLIFNLHKALNDVLEHKSGFIVNLDAIKDVETKRIVTYIFVNKLIKIPELSIESKGYINLMINDVKGDFFWGVNPKNDEVIKYRNNLVKMINENPFQKDKNIFINYLTSKLSEISVESFRNYKNILVFRDLNKDNIRVLESKVFHEIIKFDYLAKLYDNEAIMFGQSFNRPLNLVFNDFDQALENNKKYSETLEFISTTNSEKTVELIENSIKRIEGKANEKE